MHALATFAGVERATFAVAFAGRVVIRGVVAPLCRIAQILRAGICVAALFLFCARRTFTERACVTQRADIAVVARAGRWFEVAAGYRITFVRCAHFVVHAFEEVATDANTRCAGVFFGAHTSISTGNTIELFVFARAVGVAHV